MPVVSPVSLAAHILHRDTLDVVRALEEARAAAPGATEGLLLVLTLFTAGGTVTHHAGMETVGVVRARTGNICLVVTHLGAGSSPQQEDQHTAQLYHI